MGVHEAYRWLRAGSRVVVVVSAFEGTTDRLLSQARSYSENADDKACALLLATGEFTTASLLALAFARAGVKAQVLGPQAIGLRTRGQGTNADPASVDRRVIDCALEQSPVVIIPGFVGVDEINQFTLLGRGGSDLTALFLAAELGATRCRLIKDVDGLYDRDPALPGPPARRFRSVSWETALTLDGGVIQHKAVLLARARGLSIEVGSFQRSDVTLVGPGSDVFYAPAPTPAPLRVALLGAGTVGGGVHGLIDPLRADFEITRVAVRSASSPRDTAIAPALVTESPVKAAAAPGDDVVVELIGGTDAAYHAVRAALSAGKHVVTANKALIAAHGTELRDLALRAGGSLRYSAAVGGAAPLLESVATLRRQGTHIESVEGVINGTTNFVLDLVQSGISLEDAIKAAQERGYAEADPSRDLDGIDAAEKLSLLVFHAFDANLRWEDVSRTGLRDQTLGELLARRREGQVVRLIASARRTPEGIVASVQPRLVDASHPLASISGAENRLVITAADGVATVVGGTGAGRWPTAQSVVADLFDLRRQLRATLPPTTHRPTENGKPQRAHPPSVEIETRPVADSARLAVVGATGAVGREVLSILSSRGIPHSRVLALASENSAGTWIPYGDQRVQIEALQDQSFRGAELAIFAASADIARKFAPLAVAAGAVVVDNSSAFRLDPRIPLIVPEINGSHITAAAEPPRLIANPNCSTVILLTAVEPLRRSFGVTSISVATYQAVSGAGLAAMDELRSQTRRVLDGNEPSPSFFKEPCAFNVFSHDSDVDANTGLNVEERKIIDEARKIWGDPALPITPTCVRVPVLRAHTQAITVRLATPATEAQVRAAYAAATGVSIIDDRPSNRFPTPLLATGRDDVLVGRLRPDPAASVGPGGSCDSWCLLACGDQLRKGAATNALQIADLLALAEIT
ncbi:MAG: hypothetical protein AMXMBFR58_35230 [Phycisphaerae bacterium]